MRCNFKTCPDSGVSASTPLSHCLPHLCDLQALQDALPLQDLSRLRRLGIHTQASLVGGAQRGELVCEGGGGGTGRAAE